MNVHWETEGHLELSTWLSTTGTSLVLCTLDFLWTCPKRHKPKNLNAEVSDGRNIRLLCHCDGFILLFVVRWLALGVRLLIRDLVVAGRNFGWSSAKTLIIDLSDHVRTTILLNLGIDKDCIMNVRHVVFSKIQ